MEENKMNELFGTAAEIMDETTKEVENMDKKEIIAKVKSKLKEILTEREFDFLMFRFGFIDKPHTLEECGERYNVTRERAWHIEAKILRKLRHHPDILGDLNLS